MCYWNIFKHSTRGLRTEIRARRASEPPQEVGHYKTGVGLCTPLPWVVTGAPGIVRAREAMPRIGALQHCHRRQRGQCSHRCGTTHWTRQSASGCRATWCSAFISDSRADDVYSRCSIQGPLRKAESVSVWCLRCVLDAMAPMLQDLSMTVSYSKDLSLHCLFYVTMKIQFCFYF